MNLKFIHFVLAALTAIPCFGTPFQDANHTPFLTAHRPSDSQFEVAEIDKMLRFSANGETVAEVEHNIGERIISLHYLESDLGIALALSESGKLTVVNQSGESNFRGQIDMPSHIEDGPEGNVCAVSDNQTLCFSPSGELLKQSKQTVKEASSCRPTVTPSSLNLSSQGDRRSINIRFSNCSRGTLITSPGAFFNLNTLTLGRSTTVTISASASRSVNGATMAVVGSDGKIAAVVPITQYPVGSLRGSLNPNTLIANSSLNPASGWWSSMGGWANQTNPLWISVSGRRNVANTSVDFTIFANPGAARAGVVRFSSSNGAVTFFHVAQDGR
jgi:hypothetical protein